MICLMIGLFLRITARRENKPMQSHHRNDSERIYKEGVEDHY